VAEQVPAEDRLEALERWRADMDQRFAEAFPGGDHVGHCRYHDLMIDEIEERRKLRRAVQEKTISGLVWAGIVGLALASWHYFVDSVKKG
jgi:hypothetical protein